MNERIGERLHLFREVVAGGDHFLTFRPPQFYDEIRLASYPLSELVQALYARIIFGDQGGQLCIDPKFPRAPQTECGYE